MTLQRVPYQDCPLCGGKAIERLGRYDCRKHALYKAPLPAIMQWCRCPACRHVFTDGYFDDAALAGLERATIIHGLGTGALRDAVREDAATHPLVKGVRPGERGEGGDGATILTF